MHRMFMCLAVCATTLGAQQQNPGTTRTVSHPYDRTRDVTVALLGEDSLGSLSNGLRTADPSARTCAPPSVPISGSNRAVAAVPGVAAGSVPIPAGWGTRTVPVFDTPTSGAWSKLVVWISAQEPGLSAEKQTQASVEFGSVAGFPTVRLQKDSRVLSTLECRTMLAASRPGSEISASATTPDRGSITYVLGYAQVNDSVWVSYLSSTTKAADVPLLRALFQSIAVSPTQ